MQYIDQINRRRFTFAALIAYALAALVAGVVPILIIGLFPDFGGDPLASQRKLSEMVSMMGYARLATLVTGGIAIVAVAAWVQGAYANLRALPSASAPMHRWLATILVLVPGVNLIGAPIVMWQLLEASKRAAGERGEWFRFSGTQIVGAWVGVMVLSWMTSGYLLLTFEPSASVSQLANLQLMLLTIRALDVVFAGITAMILHRVDQLQEAARTSAVPSEVFE